MRRPWSSRALAVAAPASRPAAARPSGRRRPHDRRRAAAARGTGGVPRRRARPRYTASFQTLPRARRELPGRIAREKILERGRLVVGISADSRLLGSRNLLTNKFEGIDIEMANRVARALFGDDRHKHLVFKTINAAQRIAFLQNGDSRHGRPGHDHELRPLERSRVLRSRTSTSYPAGARPEEGQEPSLSALAPRRSGSARPTGRPASNGCAASTRGRSRSASRSPPTAWSSGSRAGRRDHRRRRHPRRPRRSRTRTRSVVGRQGVGAGALRAGRQEGERRLRPFLNALLEQMRGDGDWQRAYAASGLQAVLKDRTQPAADFSRGDVTSAGPSTPRRPSRSPSRRRAGAAR